MTGKEIRELPVNTDLPECAETVPLAMAAKLSEQNLLLREIAAQLAELNQNMSGLQNAVGIIADGDRFTGLNPFRSGTAR